MLSFSFHGFCIVAMLSALFFALSVVVPIGHLLGFKREVGCTGLCSGQSKANWTKKYPSVISLHPKHNTHMTLPHMGGGWGLGVLFRPTQGSTVGEGLGGRQVVRATGVGGLHEVYCHMDPSCFGVHDVPHSETETMGLTAVCGASFVLCVPILATARYIHRVG